MVNPVLDVLRPQPTGGLIVTFREGIEPSARGRMLSRFAGARVAAFSATADFSLSGADFDSILFNELGVAVVSERSDIGAVANNLRADDAVEEVRPEFWMFPIQAFEDTAERTWGVGATGAHDSPYTGEGIRICVLDTGIDSQHPDFAGRSIQSRSFVPNEAVDDLHGHGTHCSGTAAGDVKTAGVLRYGIAPKADLYIGKVLNNAGSGQERWILAGMTWAREQGCHVISMSLGRPVRPGEQFSLEYDRAGQLALNHDSLIIAAAGNESSRRFGHIAPVGAPANSPSILAVAAIDQAQEVAEFSCGGINAGGGEVDIAAPGVGVFSSVPRPRNYQMLPGTSMACPHVAGIAALWAQSDPNLRGLALWEKLKTTAKKLEQEPRDVGAGLVQAPSSAYS